VLLGNRQSGQFSEPHLYLPWHISIQLPFSGAGRKC
jgi:hypothetical protein